MLGCLLLGLGLGVGLGMFGRSLPAPLNTALIYGVLAAVMVFCVRQLVWLRQFRREVEALGAERPQRPGDDHGH
jgi:hypothetical protein